GVFAAVAEAALVEAIVAVAEEAAFRIHAITAGPTAVAAGAVALNPELKRISAAVVLTPPGSLEVLLLDRGELRLARVLPRFSMGDGAGGPDARHATATDRPRESAQRLVDRIRSALQEAGELPGCQYKEVELFGPDDTVGPLAAALGALEDGRPVILPAADDVRALTPAALASYGATTLPPGPLAFVTEVQRAWLRRNDRRRVTVLVGSALLCSAVAGAFRLADLHRELAAVREQRAAIQPSVREALDARAAIDALRARYTALMEIEANRPRRLELPAALAEALPNDAHLFSFEAGAEGVRVEGRAQSGATVASALEAAAAFRSALFVAPVRREDTPNGTFERFSLTIE